MPDQDKYDIQSDRWQKNAEDHGRMDAQLATLTSDVKVLDTKVKALDTKVEVLDTKVEALDTKVKALDTKVEVLDTKVEALDTKVEVLNTEVGTLKTKAEVLDTKIDNLEAKVDKVEEDVKGLRQDIQRGFEKIGERFDGMINMIASVNQKIEDQGKESRKDLYRLITTIAIILGVTIALGALMIDLFDLLPAVTKK